jgi:hypothetical protein
MDNIEPPLPASKHTFFFGKIPFLNVVAVPALLEG